MPSDKSSPLLDQLDGLDRAPRVRALIEGIRHYRDHSVFDPPDTNTELFEAVILRYKSIPYAPDEAEEALERAGLFSAQGHRLSQHAFHLYEENWVAGPNP